MAAQQGQIDISYNLQVDVTNRIFRVSRRDFHSALNAKQIQIQFFLESRNPRAALHKDTLKGADLGICYITPLEDDPRSTPGHSKVLEQIRAIMKLMIVVSTEGLTKKLLRCYVNVQKLLIQHLKYPN